MSELASRLERLLRQKDWPELKRVLGAMDPVRLSRIIDNLPERDRVVLFRVMPRDTAKETFQHLSHSRQAGIIKGLAVNARRLTTLLNDLNPDDRTAFFEELPGGVARRLMRLLSADRHETAVRLLGYPKESVGRLMTPECLAVKPSFTVREALSHIRKFGRAAETLNVIYVVDEGRKLLDALSIRDILLADPAARVAGLCDNRFNSLNAYADRESAVKMFKDYDLTVLPVVDDEGILLGIVTVDDVIDVAEAEHTEDFHKFGGSEGLDESYTRTPLLGMVKKRAGWLVALFLSEMLTASAMGHFDAEIAKAVVLAIFVPLIISSGGNSGSQAAGLIIRALALEELRPGNWWYVMRKEICSGFMLGGILGVIGFIRIAIWQKTGLYDYGEYWPWVALSVATSLVFIVLWGTLAGSMIPLLLKRLRLDPAAASAPFVATLVDVTGLIIYFSIAAVFLSGKLL